MTLLSMTITFCVLTLAVIAVLAGCLARWTARGGGKAPLPPAASKEE